MQIQPACTRIQTGMESYSKVVVVQLWISLHQQLVRISSKKMSGRRRKWRDEGM